MNAASRRMEIFRILQEKTTAEVNDLAEQFSVSTMTIRRDLAMFERQGLITTSYGGAYINKGSAIEPSFSLKQGQMADAKLLIAKRAAEFVHDGDSLILDCGTTTLHMLKFIQSKRVTVITNSWACINYLQGNHKIRLILAPGEYDEVSAGVISGLTIDFYKNFHADFAFISTQGFSLNVGASVPVIEDASVKKALMEAAQKKILLIDHSKFEQNYLAKHASPSDFDVILTDGGAPIDYIEKLKMVCSNVEVVCE